MINKISIFVFSSIALCLFVSLPSNGAQKNNSPAIRAENITPDQVKVAKNLDRLVKKLSKQGKSKEQIYSIISKQTQKLFSGNVIFDREISDSPWILTSDGKLHVYSLTNSKDQALAYVYQALMLLNDPLYQAKRSKWLRATKKLNSLNNNLTFESDYAKARKLRDRILTLSKEITRRESEIFS